jgi:hypothetical protein
MKPNIDEAVVVFEENGEYRECILADFKDRPVNLVNGSLVKGILKSQADDKYEVDILDRRDIPKGTISLAETSLGIPVTVKSPNAIGETVELVGVTNWNSDFDAEEIEVYTREHGIETVRTSDISPITSWVVP